MTKQLRVRAIQVSPLAVDITEGKVYTRIDPEEAYAATSLKASANWIIDEKGFFIRDDVDYPIYILIGVVSHSASWILEDDVVFN